MPAILVEVPDTRLAVRHLGDKVIVSHAIAHRHPNPCDFSGEKPELDSLVDFHAEVEVLPDSLPAAVRKREAGSPVAERFQDADSIGVEPGFIEEVRVAGRKGYRISMGAEGCGEIVVYLPSGESTVRMARRKVAEFDPAAGAEAATLGKLPGIISTREAEDFAARILASARVRGPEEKR